MQLPAFSPEDAAKFLQTLNTTDEQGPVQKGIDQSVSKALSGMTSGEGVASLPLYMFPPTAVGLQAESTMELPGQVGEAATKFRQGDYSGGASSTTDALINAMMTAGIIHGGAKMMGGEGVETPSVADRVEAKLSPEAAKPPPYEYESPETGFKFTVDPNTGEAVDASTAKLNKVLASKGKVSETDLPSSNESAQPDVTPATPDEFQTSEAQAGQRDTAPAKPATVGESGEPTTGDETGIGVAERYAEEELGDGSVIPGTSKGGEYWREKGREYVNSGQDPRMPIRAAVAGHVSPRNVGIVSAEYERLAQNRRAAADALEQRPTDPQLQQQFKAADDATRTWRQEMQPVMSRWAEAGHTMQGELPVDLTTFDGLHQRATEINGGRPPTITQKAELMKRAGVGRKLRTAEGQAVAARDAVIDRTLPKVEAPTPERMQSMVDEMVKRMTPCG
jgi:hypothetical protein